MTEDRKARTRRKRVDEAKEDAAPQEAAEDDKAGAHTELRPAGEGPRPRSKVLPREVGEDDSDDDLFNDMPV